MDSMNAPNGWRMVHIMAPSLTRKTCVKRCQTRRSLISMGVTPSAYQTKRSKIRTMTETSHLPDSFPAPSSEETHVEHQRYCASGRRRSDRRGARVCKSHMAAYPALVHVLRGRLSGPRERGLCQIADAARPAIQRDCLRPRRGHFLRRLFFVRGTEQYHPA